MARSSCGEKPASVLVGLARAVRWLALALRRQGRLAECCAAAERALAHADAARDQALRRQAIGTLTAALCDGPEPVGATTDWMKGRAKDQLEVAQAAFDKKNYSLALDLLILLRTIQAVLWPVGVR